MDWHKAHAEAHRLEHAISPYVEARLAKALGYPKTNPFGQIIPGYGDDLKRPPLKPLVQAAEGESTVVERVPEEDSRLLEYFDKSGLKPGAALKVKEMAYYKEPYKDVNSRKPLWRWPNELPISGKPADVMEAVITYITASSRRQNYPRFSSMHRLAQ